MDFLFGVIVLLFLGSGGVGYWAFSEMDSGPKRSKIIAVSIIVLCVSVGAMFIVGPHTSSPGGGDKETKPSYNDVKDMIIRDYYEEILK